MKKSPILVYAYTDYRAYLKDYYHHQCEASSAFSYRSFSKKAGLKSPSILKLVYEGQRNLTQDAMEKFIKALSLQSSEAEYFRNLVGMNQAKTPIEKERYAEKLLQSKGYQEIQPLRQEQYFLYKFWYIPPIRELVSHVDFKESAKWIASKMLPKISEKEARLAIRVLKRLHLIHRKNNGRLEPTEEFVSGGDEVFFNFAARFHREMIQKARESIDLIPRNDRDISSITMSLTESQFKHIKDKIQKFRKEALAQSKKSEENQRVYQLNFQLFPLTDD